MTDEKTKETRSKMSSRKFVVWFVWLLITVLLIVFCIITAITTQTMQENAISLLETIIGYFFAISMMYLGMNVGQKVGLSFGQKNTEKTETEKTDFESLEKTETVEEGK